MVLLHINRGIRRSFGSDSGVSAMGIHRAYTSEIGTESKNVDWKRTVERSWGHSINEFQGIGIGHHHNLGFCCTEHRQLRLPWLKKIKIKTKQWGYPSISRTIFTWKQYCINKIRYWDRAVTSERMLYYKHNQAKGSTDNIYLKMSGPWATTRDAEKAFVNEWRTSWHIKHTSWRIKPQAYEQSGHRSRVVNITNVWHVYWEHNTIITMSQP